MKRLQCLDLPHLFCLTHSWLAHLKVLVRLASQLLKQLHLLECWLGSRLIGLLLLVGSTLLFQHRCLQEPQLLRGEVL